MKDEIIDFPEVELLTQKESRKYIKLAQKGDKEAIDKLVKHNMKLILKVVYRFKNSGYDLQDLFQVGVIGFIKAVNNFDLTKDFRLSTYAVTKILGEIRLYLRDDNYIKVSRSLKRIAKIVKSCEENLKKELNRAPTINEISESCNLSKEKIVQALEASKIPTSIYKPLNQSQGKDLFLIDCLKEENNNSYDKSEKVSLIESIRKLDKRSRKIVFYRYFKDMTQSEIAEKIGVSQVQISRLEKKILKKLKEAL